MLKHLLIICLILKNRILWKFPNHPHIKLLSKYHNSKKKNLKKNNVKVSQFLQHPGYLGRQTSQLTPAHMPWLWSVSWLTLLLQGQYLSLRLWALWAKSPVEFACFSAAGDFFFPFSSQRCPLPTDMRRGPDTRFLFCPVLKIFFWLWKWPTLEQSRKVLACLSDTLVIKASRFFSTLVERKKNTWDSESLGPLTSHFLNVSQPHSLTDSPRPILCLPPSSTHLPLDTLCIRSLA